MQRARPRVKLSTREAFRLALIEILSGAEAAGRLGTTVSGMFVAKHRVMELLEEEEVWILKDDRREGAG